MKNLRYAFLKTLPVLCGYLFLGTAFGLLMHEAGYGWGWSALTSLIVYAGSMQFVLVGLLASGAGLVTAALTALMVNGRHLFYGLSFIDRFKSQGPRYPYLALALTDETYSLLCAADYPPDIDPREADFLISLLDQGYWVAGSALGGLLGQALTFDFTGIDFSMTALFVVLLVEQMRVRPCRPSALIGFGAAVVMLFALGAAHFLLPALGVISLLVLVLRAPIERLGVSA